MNKVPQLRVVLLGLIAGLRAVSSIMLLMLLVMFLFSITGNVLFGENDPAHFHSVETGILTLFQVGETRTMQPIPFHHDRLPVPVGPCDPFFLFASEVTPHLFFRA
jgi:hypothetical protein